MYIWGNGEMEGGRREKPERPIIIGGHKRWGGGEMTNENILRKRGARH